MAWPNKDKAPEEPAERASKARSGLLLLFHLVSYSDVLRLFLIVCRERALRRFPDFSLTLKEHHGVQKVSVRLFQCCLCFLVGNLCFFSETFHFFDHFHYSTSDAVYCLIIPLFMLFYISGCLFPFDVSKG